MVSVSLCTNYGKCVRGSDKIIPNYHQQDATFLNLFISIDAV